MSESAAVEATPTETPDVFNGETPTVAEFTKYREDGTLPERFKPAENAGAAPADASEKTEDSDIVGESETPDQQQERTERRPKLTAQERIAEIQAKAAKTIRDIRRGAGLPDEEVAASSPAKPEPKPEPVQQSSAPQNYAEWKKSFKADPWIEQFANDNPEASFGDATAAMNDYQNDMREHFKNLEDQRRDQTKAFEAEAEKARERYENFDDVVAPFATTINTDPQINPVVRAMFLDSEVTPDLLFTIGSDEEESAKFLKMAKEEPGKAIRYIAVTEKLIIEEQAAKPRDGDGKFVAATPAKPTPKAPKPPSTVGGTSSRAFDVSDDSLSADEWMRKRNLQLASKT